MRMVVERTGLSPHVIRAWERRHGAIIAKRSDGNRRLFTLDDINRLVLLRRGVVAGHSIAQIARLPLADLRALVAPEPARDAPSGSLALESHGSKNYIELALDAIRDLKASRLQDVFDRVEADRGRYRMMTRMIPELLDELGDLWRKGEIRPYQEHFATGLIRSVLGTESADIEADETQPLIVLATPSGTFHELGCLLAQAEAQRVGWRAVYLGCGLALEDIVEAAGRSQARAVGLSIVYPVGDSMILSDLRELRLQLPADTILLLGGRAAASYSELKTNNIRIVQGLSDLGWELERLGGGRSEDSEN